MSTEVHAFKLNNEDFLKGSMRLYTQGIHDKFDQYYLDRNFVFDASQFKNDSGFALLEVFLVLYYLRLFNGLQGGVNATMPELGIDPILLRNQQLDELSLFLVNRSQLVVESIGDTITNNLQKTLRDTVADKLNDNAVVQEQTFINEPLPVGAFANSVAAQISNQRILNNGDVDLDDIITRNLDQLNTGSDTTNRDLALGSLIVFNQRMDKQGVVDDMSEGVDKDLQDSLDRLAMTETQVATETFRADEADAIKHIAGATVLVQKVWRAILDRRVRLWHEEADGQRQTLGTPFTVHGELLNYPGDSSLGAGLDNIINCRCEAIYVPLEIIKGTDGIVRFKVFKWFKGVNSATFNIQSNAH